MSSLASHPDDNSTTRQSMAREVVRRQGLFATSKRKLVAALIASIIAHLVAGLFVDDELPQEKIIPLTATFMKLPPPPTASTSVAAKPKAKPPRPKREANAATASLPTIPTESTTSAPESVEPAEKIGDAEAKPATETTTEKVAQAPEPVAAPAEVTPLPAVDASKLPPKKIQLGYTAFLGENKSELGPVQLTFTHENGRYKMRINGRARVLFSVFAYNGESEGAITADGLRPDKFTEEAGSPPKRREALFDHTTKKVTIPDKDPLAIEGMAHDPLTWIVQFYFAMPKSEKATFSVASTRRMDVYTLERSGKDNISTPIGAIDTQIWKGARKVREDGTGGGGSAQFWLAPDWHFIPFQVKVVDNRGRSLYLELTAINTE
jgi:cytoskeletal protein RodZ